MERIKACFELLEKAGEKPLIVYATACDPRCSKSLEIFRLILRYADMVEIGMPFSDPLADGPTIQKAHVRALSAGANTRRIFELVEELRRDCHDTPFLLMGYYNPIFVYGEKRFVRDAKAIGVDGFIVPDLPPEEGEGFAEFVKSEGLSPVFLAAPTSTDERVAMIGRVTGEFIYYVSVTGITGERESLSFKEIEEDIARIKRITGKRTVVGFGISRGSHIREMYNTPDGFVVGSAVVRRVEENRLEDLRFLLQELKDATKSP
jgi:tryptophan synthase alpha chain